ncbi:MAG: DUF1565 domain-containing protein, partial [Lentisphaerae bacterium]
MQMLRQYSVWLMIMALLVGGKVCGAAKKDRKSQVSLPLPEERLPDAPAYPPSVVTAGGQRLLLSYVPVRLSYDPILKRFSSSHPGWWLINFPLRQIKGLERKTEDEIAQLIFKRPRAELKNWYIYVPGTPPPEPQAPTGPAPIERHRGDIIVNNSAPNAADHNPGNPQLPLKTIQKALERAQPGQTIHIYPGIYRESFRTVRAGTAERPIRIEGVRGKDGAMPVITGNDLIPADRWEQVPGLENVYRASIITGLEGPVSVDGRMIRERTLPSELKPFEYCFNRGTREMAFPMLAPSQSEDPRFHWRKATADKDGYLLVADKQPDHVFYASTWVWMPPKKRKEGVVWDPRFPEPITGRVACGGPFRTYRMTGVKISGQANLMRVWLNGVLMPGPFTPGFPRAESNYGHSEQWQHFRLREGWNHLFFQFDTSLRDKNKIIRFRMRPPQGVAGLISQADKPGDMKAPPANGKVLPYIAAWKITPGHRSKPDRGLYLCLPKGKRPADYT